MEEMVKYHNNVCVEQSSSPCNHKDHGHPGRANEKRGRNERLAQEPKCQVFSPLNISLAPLFEEAYNINMITLPPQC
ncbi:hypothetical protein CR513_42340, partial [Mucuna pruriens]